MSGPVHLDEPIGWWQYLVKYRPFVLLLGFLLCSGGVRSAWGEGRLFQHPLGQLPTVLTQVFQQARQLTGFATGPKQAPHLLVFFDPDCPFCAHFWQSLKPWRQHFRVRWVPVAYVRPSSLGRAVALLQAPHPAQALAVNEGHFDYAAHRGGLIPAYQPPAALRAAVRRNTRFWKRELSTLPACFYQGQQGPHLLVGVPSAPQWHKLYTHATRSWPQSP